MDNANTIDLLSEILGQLGDIVKAQKSSASHSSQGTSDKNLNITVSGDSIGILQTIVKSDGVADKLGDVATGFEMLNSEIDKFNSLNAFNDKGAFVSVLDFIDKMSRHRDFSVFNKIPKNAGQNIRSLFENLNLMFKDIDLSNFKNVPNISGLTDFVSDMYDNHVIMKAVVMNAELKLFGKSGLKNFFDAMADIFSDNAIRSVVFNSNFDSKSKANGVEGIMALMKAITSISFLTRVKIASKALSVKDAQDIADFFHAFAGSMNSKQSLQNATAMKSIADTLIEVLSPKFLAGIILARPILSEKTGKSIGEFFSALAGGLADASDEKFNAAKTKLLLDSISMFFLKMTGIIAILALESVLISKMGGTGAMAEVTVMMVALVVGAVQLAKIIADSETTFDNANKSLDGLVTVIFKLTVAMLILSAASVIVSQGETITGIIAMAAIVMLTIGIVAYIQNALADNSDEMLEAEQSFMKMTLELAASVLLIGVAMKVASTVSAGDGLKSLFMITLGILTVFALIWVADHIKLLNTESTAKLILMTIGLSVAALLIASTIKIAEGIEWKSMLKFVGIIGLMLIMMAAIGVVGMLPITGPAILAMLGISVVVLIMSAVLLNVLNMITTAEKISKGMKSLKEMMKGLMDIFDDIGVFGAVKGAIVTVGLIAFAVAGLMLVFIAAEILAAGKLAGLVKPADMKHLQNTITGLIDILDMIDENHNWLGAIGQMVQLVALSVAIGMLLVVVALSVLVMKINNFVKPKDMVNLRNTINGLIGILDMIDENHNWLGSAFLLADIAMLSASLMLVLGMVVIAFLVMKLNSFIKPTDIQGLKTTVNGLTDMLWDIAGKAAVLGIISPLLVMFEFVMGGLLLVVTGYIAVLKYYKNATEKFGNLGTLSASLASDFKTFIKTISDSFSFGDMVAGTVVSLWTASLLPMFAAVNSFIDMVSKVAKMQVITGYDEHGKPKYETLPANVFETAAKTVGDGFTSFIKQMHTAFNAMKGDSADTISDLSEAMLPLMDTVSGFVDSVIKLATSTIPNKWDKNGKPISYRTVKPSEYTSAAKVLTDNFGKFIRTVGTEASKLGEPTTDAIKELSNGIAPLMQTVSGFADSIIKLSSLMIPDRWDENGNAIHYYHIRDAKVFTKAGANLANGFVEFVEALSSGLGTIHGQIEDIVDDIADDDMKNLMNIITSFSKIITDNMWVISRYDTNGNPIFFRGKDGKMVLASKFLPQAGASLAAGFTGFMTSLLNGLSEDNLASKTKQVAAIMSSVKLDSINDYVETVSKYAKLSGGIKSATSIATAIGESFGALYRGMNGGKNDNYIHLFAAQRLNIKYNMQSVDLIMNTAAKFAQFSKYDFKQILTNEDMFVHGLKKFAETDIDHNARRLISGSATMIYALRRLDAKLSGSSKAASGYAQVLETAIGRVSKAIDKFYKKEHEHLDLIATKFSNIGKSLKLVNEGLTSLNSQDTTKFNELAETFAQAQTEAMNNMASTIAAQINTAQATPTATHTTASEKGNVYVGGQQGGLYNFRFTNLTGGDLIIKPEN